MQWTFAAWERASDVPPWGNANRLAYLRDFARTEPILAGALSSMVSKVSSMDWYVSGGRNRAAYGRDLLANASDGDGWNKLLDKWAQDYLGTDFGGALELARDTPGGPVTGVYNFDAATLKATGNRAAPLALHAAPQERAARQEHLPARARPTSATSSTCPRRKNSGWTWASARVSRAIKAARVLLALYEYDEEKLADMPMPGLVTVSGMLMSRAGRSLQALRRHAGLQAAGAFQATALAGVRRGLAEHRRQADLVRQPAGELRPRADGQPLRLHAGAGLRRRRPRVLARHAERRDQGRGRSAGAEGQGQGLWPHADQHGARRSTGTSCPPTVEFGFDRQDDDADLAQSILHGQLNKNARLLWEPAASTGQGIITTEEARRLLVEQGALPAWIAPTPEVILYGNSQDESIKAYERSKMQRWANKAAAADLGPGEDYVRVNLAGDYEVLWSSATFRSVCRAGRWPHERPAQWCSDITQEA